MDTAPQESKQESGILNTQPQAVVVRREAERDLVTWTAPARPFKVRDRQFFVTVFAIAGVISLVLFLAEGIMPVLLVVALVFLYYVLSTVPPENIEYKITSKGIKVAGKLTEWQVLTRFWFEQKSGAEVLIFDTLIIPGRLEVVINPEIKEELRKQISAYVPFEEVSASGIEKMANWVSQKLPGNR